MLYCKKRNFVPLQNYADSGDCTVLLSVEIQALAVQPESYSCRIPRLEII